MIQLLLAVILLPLVLPAFSLLALTLAALGVQKKPTKTEVSTQPPPRVAVLVPAHNESVHLLPTIACLRAQLRPEDRLVVVADNCTDDTAALGREAGGLVIERHDEALRGKGYALAFGVDYLRADPPDVVLVVDADCLVSPGAVAAIAQDCHATGHPVQMLNLMRAGEGAGLKIRVLEFAMRVKNLVRPLGSYRLGRACHLMGTGMALPWSLMSSAKLATGHITEDMKLGIELTRAGYAPRFLVDVRVSSEFVTDTGVARVQKSRWEHGHLATITEELPGLLRSALRTLDPGLIVLAMDLMIPPVAFYFLVMFGVLAVMVVMAWLWPVFFAAAVLSAFGTACFVLAVGLAWFFFGRHLLSARELLTTPLYAFWKLPVYVAYFLKKRSGWVRTKRKV